MGRHRRSTKRTLPRIQTQWKTMQITLAQPARPKHHSQRMVTIIRKETILITETVGEQVGSDIIKTGGTYR